MEIRELLNLCAETYCNAKNLSDKREALINYLDSLEMLAVREGYEISLARSDPGSWGDVTRIAQKMYPYGVPPHYNLRPLLELKEALLRLNNRESPELFCRSRSAGRPPTQRVKLHCWSRAAALITILMERYNKSEDDAARLVVERLTAERLPLPGRPTTNTPTVKLLQGWRDQMKCGAKGELAMAWYKTIADMCLRSDNLPPDAMELIRQLLSRNAIPVGFTRRVNPIGTKRRAH